MLRVGDDPGDPVFFYGGLYDTWADEGHHDDAWRWDASAGRWEELAQSATRPSPRSGFAYAEGTFNFFAEQPGPPVFVAGGRCSPAGLPTLCDDAWRATWDGSQLAWLQGPTGGTEPSARVGAAGLLVDNGLYPRFRAYGGQLGNQSVVAEDWTFAGAGQVDSFENGTWSLEADAAWPALFDAAAVPVPYSGGNRAYVVGGFNVSGEPQAGVWVSPLSAGPGDDWLSVSMNGAGELPARGGATANVIDSGTVLVFGGDGATGPLADLWLFSCTEESDITDCVSVDVTALPSVDVRPEPRAHHAARYDAASDTLWIFGGYGGGRDGVMRELWSVSPVVAGLVTP